MKYLIQRPLPDELLGSVWIRSRRRAGVGIGLATKLITGRKFAPGVLSYAHVVDLAGALRTDPLNLLWKHSIFPYATAYVSPKVFQSSVSSALSTGHAAAGCGPTVQSVSDHVRHLRFCRQCAIEDSSQWGESYWHRAHNLPGVRICLKHLNPLIETLIPATQLAPWPDVLPLEIRNAKPLRPRIDAFTTGLTELSCRLLNRTAVAPVLREPVWYREKLVAAGLLSPGRQLESKYLRQWALVLLGSHVKYLGLARRDLDCHWMALMVRPRESIPFVPVKHVIFETLLGLPSEATEFSMDYTPVGMAARPSEPADVLYANKLRKVIRYYRQQGERVRVNDALREAGCFGPFRHDRKRFPRVRELVKQLRASEVSVRRINPA